MLGDLVSDLVGKPYRAGARGPEEYDCFGLVAEVYRRLGWTIPLEEETETDLFGERAIALEEIPPEEWEEVPIPNEIGDVLLFRAPAARDEPALGEEGVAGHCAVYIGGGQLLHATAAYGVHQVSWRLMRTVCLRVLRLRARALGTERSG